jgi:tetratricopeptide (TPR) repeat protein
VAGVGFSVLLATDGMATGLASGLYEDLKGGTRKVYERYTSNRVEGGFADLYPQPLSTTATGKKLLGGGSSLLSGALAWMTGGGLVAVGATGPLADWIGSRLGSLADEVTSGAPTTRASILGGDTLASGGFGLAGVAAVLASVSDVGVGMAIRPEQGNPVAARAGDSKFGQMKLALPKKGNPAVVRLFVKAEQLRDELEAKRLKPESYAALVRELYDEALGRLQEIDPASEYAGYDYLNLAVLRYNFMQFAATREALEQARPYVQNTAFIDYVQALLELVAGGAERALPHLNAAIAAEPTAMAPYVLLTIVHMDQGKPHKALLVAEQGLEATGDRFELLWRAAELSHHNLREYERAIAYYKRALEQVSTGEMQAQCRIMIALGYKHIGDLKSAATWKQEALAAVANNSDAVRTIEETYRDG